MCIFEMPAPVNDVIACFNYLTIIGIEICTSFSSSSERVCSSDQVVITGSSGLNLGPPATAPWYVLDFAVLSSFLMANCHSWDIALALQVTFTDCNIDG